MKEIFAVKKNFLLVKERSSSEFEKGRTVIQTSGYTTTPQAIKQNWFLTQLQTIPYSDRSNLPDPWILQHADYKAYEELDCNVFTLYFLPWCKGLQSAMVEFADYLDCCFSSLFPRNAIIGHSKGGLFVAGLTKSLDISTNIAMITPTFGTVMGDKLMAHIEMDKHLASRKSMLEKAIVTPEVALYKRIVNIICSERPIDYDMTIGSEFLRRDFDFSRLKNHNTLLVTAKCPKKCHTLDEAFFKLSGKLVGLDKIGDGMVSLESQRLVSGAVDKEVLISATHPTALDKAMPYIKEFLSNVLVFARTRIKQFYMRKYCVF